MFDEDTREAFAERLQRVAQNVQDTDEIQTVIGRLRVDAPLTLKDLCIIKSAVETQLTEFDRTKDRLLEDLENPIRDAYHEQVETIAKIAKEIKEETDINPVYLFNPRALVGKLMGVYYELSEVQL